MTLTTPDVLAVARADLGVGRGAATAVGAASAASDGVAGRGRPTVRILPLRETPDIVARWRDLADRALEPNPYYDPDYALPAALPFGEGVRLLVVTEGPDPDARFLALWPFRLLRRRWGLPLRVAMSWTQPYATLCTPLVDRERADEALDALFGRPVPGLPRRAVIPLLPVDGAFGAALTRLQARRGLRERRLGGYVRAMLKTTEPAGYLERALSSSSRAKLRQETRRLEKRGRLTHEVVTDPAAIGAAMDHYIRLEASGWKARAGTAVSQSNAEIAFLRGSTERFAARGCARVDQLCLDGRPIASSIAMIQGGDVWYAKISFDDAEAKNSPGSQLVTRVTEAFLADPAFWSADSCAPPGHPLMRRFWSEDLRMGKRVLEIGGRDPLHRLAAALEGWRDALSDRLAARRDRLRAAREAALRSARTGPESAR